MATATATRASTGIAALDEILHGGLVPGRAYLQSFAEALTEARARNRAETAGATWNASAPPPPR